MGNVRVARRITSCRFLALALVLMFSGRPNAGYGAPLFGRHLPHGTDAVAYLYGPNGTWREQTNVHYGWNFYKHCETPSHLYDPSAVLREASISNTTAPDANCLILGDVNSNGELYDDTVSGFAFHEHAGRGVLGEQREPPSYQFWFDDNWLARYVAESYNRPHPIGLHDFGHPIRWRTVGGDSLGWTPYSGSSPHVDQIALNGLFKLNAGDFDGALGDWRRIRDSSGSLYDSNARRFRYSFANDSIYYYGLWAILSERLLSARASFPLRSEVLQHATSLHSWLLALQERDASGGRLGWRTGTVPQALINTETTSLAILALGAHASWVLEPGHAPLRSAAGNYVHDNHALSAVAGQSVPGHIVYGPYFVLPPATYDVDFALRSRATRVDTPVATLEIYDGHRVAATLVLEGTDAPTHDQWRRYRLTAEVQSSENLTEFRVYWHGSYDLDVGAVRVIRRSAPTPSSLVTVPAAATVATPPELEARHVAVELPGPWLPGRHDPMRATPEQILKLTS